jgi:uncharacterized protein with FMN-binding domain
LFFAAFSTEDLTVIMKISFGIGRSRIQQITRMMGKNKDKKKESSFSFSDIPKEILKAQIGFYYFF